MDTSRPDSAPPAQPSPIGLARAPFLGVLLVFKKSKLQLYTRDRKNAHIQALIDAGDASVQQLEAAHAAHHATLGEVRRVLKGAGVPLTTVYRAGLSRVDTRGMLVVTVGGDGTVLDASHAVKDAVILGVNSDPSRSTGSLCAADKASFAETFAQVWDGRWPASAIPRLRVDVDGVVHPPVLNDVLIADRNPAAMSQYFITHGGHTEKHRNSGLWLAAPAGSSAAIASAGAPVVPLETEGVQYRAREPYLAADAKLLSGTAALDAGFTVVSKMRQGRLYVDGPHLQVKFPLGATARIDGRAPPLALIVSPAMRAWRIAHAQRVAAADERTP